MNITTIKNAVTSKAARQVLLSKKHSPTILFVGGVVGVAGTVVLACRATLKVEDVLDKHDVKVRTANLETNTEKRRKKELTRIQVELAGDLVKLYAPAVGLGVVSVAALTGSHVVLQKRNTALMAAYATLSKGFDEYRARVREEFGEDKEKQIRMAGKEIEVHDTEKGTVTKKKVHNLPGERSIYARLWDRDTSQSCQRDNASNLAFLSAKQNYLNDRLRARGHVLLNDAYDELGLSRTSEGCVVGWVMGNGDNLIDFGIFTDDNQNAFIDWVRGDEEALWLDFNVDGVVYELIGREHTR